MQDTKRGAGFTLVELLVVIAVVALLIGVLLPALGRARQAAQNAGSGSNLRQLGQGLAMYGNDYDNELPQVRVNDAGEIVRRPEGSNVGALFGGKLGTLPVLGINEIGPERRPLNQYVTDTELPADGSPSAAGFEMEIFRDPSDKGTQSPQLAFFPVDTSSVYDLVGTSYNLNDHALDSDPFNELYPTLIPREGGKSPNVRTPTKTWLIGDQAIYNYDSGTNAQMYWRGGNTVRSVLLFWDQHVDLDVTVPEGEVQTTSDYTFLPEPNWLERFGVTGGTR